MWGVNKAKPEAEKVVAWDFVKFMLAKPDDGSTRSPSCSPSRASNETAVAKNFPFFDVHMKDVATASWYLRSEFTNEIGQAIGRAIERTVYDGMDPKASLDQAQAEVDKVLKK